MTSIRLTACALLGGVAISLAGTQVSSAADDRVVIVVDPPAVETNVLWEGSIGEPLPWMQSLLGHNPQSGEFDDSGLARSWETNDDFTEWTFHLHENAEFHFGWGPVTAADVVHSYELHTQPDLAFTGANLIRAREVEAIDDHTVVFRFDEPNVDYSFQHGARGYMLVYSKAQYEEEGVEGYHARPAGTAPYQFVERRIGEGTLAESVDDHWQGIRPDFTELETRWVSEPSTKLALLLSGEAHIVALPRELQQDAVNAGMEVLPSQLPSMHTNLWFGGLYMRTDDTAYNPDLPWTDIRVREAMNRALDRETMISILYGEHAAPIARFTMDPRHEGYVPELEERFEAEYGYDPERARELLQDAGYPEAFGDPVVTLAYTSLSGNPELGLMVEMAQVYFEEIGMQTEIREMDYSVFGTMGRSRELNLVFPGRNAPIRPTEAALDIYWTTEGTPFGSFETDTIQALVEELKRTTDRDERDRIASEAYTYLYEQYADMPIASAFHELTINPNVVKNWILPGVSANGLGHFHLIEAVQ